METNDINDFSLVYLHQTRTRSQLIYTSTLLSVAITFASLPFIYTTVSIKGNGLFQSGIEKTELLSPVNGRLIEVNLHDNGKVNKGTILLVIDATLPEQQKKLLDDHRDQLNIQLHDALKLIAGAENAHPVSPLYIAGLQQYREALNNAANSRNQACIIYNRYKILYDKQAVTRSEYEQYEYNYEQALSDYEMVSKKYVNQWQTEVNQYRNEIRELANQKAQLAEQEKQYVLKAPINGALQNLTGLQKGSYVYVNQKLGEISPDSLLLAYCYVSPADIGLIKKQQEVRLQIDAFNYNQWGFITARVDDISDDIVLQNNTPCFKVKCKLNTNYLTLNNGYKGYIKKGMTFRAHFTVARRNFYQLLYDGIDDWLNPAQS